MNQHRPAWRHLEHLAASPVSVTWQVAVGERLAVLREDQPGARHLSLDRTAERAVLAAVSAAGLGPACLWPKTSGEAGGETGAGLLLTAWLPGRAWSAADLQDPPNLARAAALLQRLHRLPAALPALDLEAAVERYAGLAGPALAPLATAARRALADSRAASRRAGVPAACLCHGDPTPGNFIAGPAGGLHLIDWEYAGCCDPAFDLAGLAVGAGLTGAGVSQLLTAYRGRPPTAPELACQRSWEVFCDALGRLWVAALATTPVPGPGGRPRRT